MNKLRVALITGSGKRRVGWHVARALADRGYLLALNYHQSAAEASQTADEFRQRGIDLLLVQADLTVEADVRRMVGESLAHFGRIDVLVNCAAVWKSKPLENVTAADVMHNFETNTLSTFLCSQQVGLAMVRQPEGGCIITIGDWAEIRPYRNYPAYFVSKAAIPGLTRCLAVELGTRNPRVRVNCVLPGPVMIPDNVPEAERKQAVGATLVKRMGTPDNVAQAVLALADNDFITGVCLPVDGGRTVFAPE